MTQGILIATQVFCSAQLQISCFQQEALPPTQWACDHSDVAWQVSTSLFWLTANVVFDTKGWNAESGHEPKHDVGRAADRVNKWLV